MIAKFLNETFRVNLFVSVCRKTSECIRELEKSAKVKIDGDYEDDTVAFFYATGSVLCIGISEERGKVLESLCHESSHITMYVFDRIGMPHNNNTDEAYSYVLGWVFGCGIKALQKSGYSFYGI